MNGFKFLAIAAVAGLCFAATPSKTQAQVSVTIVAAPACPYGYYDYAPYNCAPTGYYGPEWFNGGVFIGAGQWYHGPAKFNGNVNNRYDPQHGYKGPMPKKGEKAQASHATPANFKGNETHDGHGNVTEKKS
ncbi:MAG: hypothetical protein WA419_00230 [Silvibacterium sp.]